MSSSLPEDVQFSMYKTLPGLENVSIIRNAYAIEYDCIDANQIKASLEFKAIKDLYSAGQINGSSGYEEAAVQGFMAGVNAARALQGKEAIIFDRSQAYIGVLIDDLVTKENSEPYRMMTSRAEYRLLLRQDNADLRLTEIGREIGLISEERYRYVETKKALIAKEVQRIKEVAVGAERKTQEFLEANGSAPLNTGVSLAELIRRPELDYVKVKELDAQRPELEPDVIEQVDIEIKYEGYIARQQRQVENMKRVEGRRLSEDIDYRSISGLRLEAGQKLDKFKPRSIGQASRISGVTPADISVLLIWLTQQGR
jgi:tRNA uridine 5-carboxymethylaminomethyl modification enzyme